MYLVVVNVCRADNDVAEKHVRLQSRISAAHRKDREVRDKAEEIDSIVQHFRTIIRADIKMLDEDLKSMVDELATLNAEMNKAKDYMDSAKAAFLSAHGTTLEYLGQSGEVKLNKRFHRQGERTAMCLVCTLKFNDAVTRKLHILQTHYYEAKALVSIYSLSCRGKRQTSSHMTYGNINYTWFFSCLSKVHVVCELQITLKHLL